MRVSLESMILDHATVAFGLVWDSGSPGLIFVIWMIFKLGSWFPWTPGINLIVWVIISQRIVFVVVFSPEINMLCFVTHGGCRY